MGTLRAKSGCFPGLYHMIPECYLGPLPWSCPTWSLELLPNILVRLLQILYSLRKGVSLIN